MFVVKSRDTFEDMLPVLLTEDVDGTKIFIFVTS